MPDTPTSKEAVILKLLSEGDTMLCLDARYKGVRVPPQHTKHHALRLILNYNFPQPIEVTDEGVSANLSFNGRRFACYIPMGALWAAFNPQTMQGMMWPDSMPAEVQAEFAARQEQGIISPPAPSSEATIAAPAARSRQRPVAGIGKKKTDNNDEEPPRQRGHLRIVK